MRLDRLARAITVVRNDPERYPGGLTDLSGDSTAAYIADAYERESGTHRHFSIDTPPLFCEECGKDWARVVDGRKGRRLRRERGPKIAVPKPDYPALFQTARQRLVIDIAALRLTGRRRQAMEDAADRYAAALVEARCVVR